MGIPVVPIKPGQDFFFISILLLLFFSLGFRQGSPVLTMGQKYPLPKKSPLIWSTIFWGGEARNYFIFFSEKESI